MQRTLLLMTSDMLVAVEVLATRFYTQSIPKKYEDMLACEMYYNSFAKVDNGVSKKKKKKRIDMSFA